MNALSEVPPMHLRRYGAPSPMTEPNGFPPSFAEKFAELKRAFMHQLPGRFGALQAAIAERDLARVAALAHQLRGVAGSYGLAAVSLEAERLEEAARELKNGAVMPDADDRSRLDQLLDAARKAAEGSTP
jgi:HPt (histidine-containing phosphotransfer) domain-containing protein